MNPGAWLLVRMRDARRGDLRRWGRAALVPPLCLLLIGGLHFSLPIWGTHEANLGELKRPEPSFRPPSRGERCLVLSPHCDDEVLATGGLVAEARRAGAPVEVALITNGDGFRLAAERFFKKALVKPADFIALGQGRRKESLAGLAQMGLKPGEVIFLGYPDRGTAMMWLNHWEWNDLYTSPTTKADRNPYLDSFRPGAPYAGRALLDDLEAVIKRFHPTVIFAPHPDDNHGDHWALYCYTLGALYELGLLERVKLELYLVHRGDWPVPQGLHPEKPMAPPAALARLDTRWATLPLSPRLIARKERAVRGYRSQMMIMKRFLLSFVRQEELFGTRPIGRLVEVKPGTIIVDGETRDWGNIPPAILDPAQDMGMVSLMPEADLVQVYVVREGERLLVRLELQGNASAELEYQVDLHPLVGGKVAGPRRYSFRGGAGPLATEFRAAGRSIELSLPWPKAAAGEGIMISAACRFHNYLMDKAAWTLLLPEPKRRAD